LDAAADVGDCHACVTRDESFRNRSSIGKVNIDHRLRDVCSDNGSCAGGKEAISKRQRFMSVFSRSSDRLAASAGVGCTASFLRQSASMSRLQIFGGGAGGGEGAGDGGGVSSNATGVRPVFTSADRLDVDRSDHLRVASSNPNIYCTASSGLVGETDVS
jgi:hypothetical protein